MDYRNYGRGYAEPTMSASDYMTRTYRWMACGLLITFAMAYLTATTSLIYLVDSLYLVLTIAELALVFVLSSRVQTMSVGAARATFFGYALLNGMVLSYYFLVFSASTLIMALCCFFFSLLFSLFFSFLTSFFLGFFNSSYSIIVFCYIIINRTVIFVKAVLLNGIIIFEVIFQGIFECRKFAGSVFECFLIIHFFTSSHLSAIILIVSSYSDTKEFFICAMYFFIVYRAFL